MAYSAWSVVAFEQPTTAKWNILGTNDAEFNSLISTSGGVTSVGNGSDEVVLRTQSKARASLGTNQSLTANVQTTLQLDTEQFDVGSDFNTSTYTFTAPIAGYYLTLGGSRWSVAADGDGLDLFIVVSGSGAVGGSRHNLRTSGANPQHVNTSTIVKLPAAGTIILQGRNVSNNDTVEAGTDFTFLAVHLLSKD